MRDLQNIYHHHSYTFSLLYLVVLILLCPAFSINFNILSATESLTISSNRTIVSPGDVFELGFFKLGTSSRWYLGIWYKTLPEGTYVWVANRDTPLSNSIGTLKILDANLVLLDHSDLPVWSTNLTRDGKSPMLAELLDNGNFVLRHSNNSKSGGFLWQSFDFPTDTLLPQMKIGWDAKTGLNKFLRSWRSPDNPSSGDYSYKVKIQGLSEFFLWYKHMYVYRSGPWDGIRFNGMPEMRESEYMIYNFTENTEMVAYTFLTTNHSIYSRLTMTPLGTLEQYTWNPTEPGQVMFWSSPKDPCDGYRICGYYSYCDIYEPLMCICIRGFEPENMMRVGSGYCVRKTRLSCGEGGFLRLSNMKLPDTTAAIVERKISLKECEDRCRKHCNCTAFANTDTRRGGSGCVIWTGELNDIRKYASAGQDLYVKLATTDLEDERNNKDRKVIGMIIGVISFIILLSFIIFCFWKRKLKRTKATAAHLVYQERKQNLLMNGVVLSSGRHLPRENLTDDLELPLMDFESVITATDNFSNSNMLGRGGFGYVYKGRLPDGKEIAVKRLSDVSSQGINEFMNEVRLIAKLQHINLVRLLGCCVYADEKILIYEFMENLSLDSYLFDQTQSSKLNWQKRYDITNGIARGLLYLHQDSRCRIIHRDLKASNVLLDKDMTPKISDFGMARIFATDETEASTVRIVGTYGYMSPEYAMNGVFSVKSDVFSFGVLVLEVISGKRNRGFYNSDQYNSLLGYVWKSWKDGTGLDIVDPTIIVDSSSSSSSSTFRPQEILRCIQIGLLCVQERPEDRPTMSSVVLMLGSETTAIPQPKPPSYYIDISLLGTDSSLSSKQPDEESWTTNQITLSVIGAR